jgi:hypothetical protein
MTVLFPETVHSPAAFLQRLVESMLPTSAQSYDDVLRPTELRYGPVSTNDRKGNSAAPKTAPTSLDSPAQPQLETVSRQTVAMMRSGTVDDVPGYALAAMAAATIAQDEDAFLAASRLVDWEQSDAATFETAIHLALAAGAHLAARQLATQGAALHPSAPYLQKAARILAPPQVVSRRPASNHARSTNKLWLAANRERYQDQWVALRQGELLGSNPQLNVLSERFGTGPDIVYVRVT